MNGVNQKSKIVLEDLLKIKRSERPSADFWEGFERELRSKQLAALVRPARPWWGVLVGRKMLLRAYTPIGAAAAVALSFVFTGNERPQNVASAHPVVPVLVKPAVRPSEAAATSETIPQEALVARANQADGVTTAALGAAGYVENTGPGQPAGLSAVSGELMQVGGETFRAAGQALAQIVGLVGGGSESLADGSDEIVEPLAQVATPRDSRRARLLAYSVAYDPHAAGSQDVARSRDRIARRITDDSVYDSISRLGVSGDRVSIKF